MLNQLRFLASAKINLFLHILGRNPNGYHRLQTLFQRISWFDELSFQLRQDDNIEFTTNIAEIAENNLVYQAANILKQQYSVKQGVAIHLSKNIPTGAGLGGGSSDTGTTLRALNQLWDLKLPLNTLLALAKSLGADVPIFVLDQDAWGEGIGEILTPMVLPKQWYVVLYPNCHANTTELFRHPDLPRNTPAITPESYHFATTHNDFEDLVCQLYPPVQEAKLWLSQFGPARLTGSGSSLFLPVESEEIGLIILAQAPDQWLIKVCHSL